MMDILGILTLLAVAVGGGAVKHLTARKVAAMDGTSGLFERGDRDPEKHIGRL